MAFMTFLKNLDELLFEVMSWLLFYPITLWRAVRHPLRMMAYADSELGAAAERQYTDVVSPPTFLILTLVLAHTVELAVIGDNPIVLSHRGLDNLVNDDTSLLALRLVAFALFPLTMAARLVRRRHGRLARERLKPPFYSQCYAAAPFALVFSLAGTLGRSHVPGAAMAAFGISIAAGLWYVVLQAMWFHANLGESWPRAVGNAVIGYGEALVGLAIIVALFA